MNSANSRGDARLGVDIFIADHVAGLHAVLAHEIFDHLGFRLSAFAAILRRVRAKGDVFDYNAVLR